MKVCRDIDLKPYNSYRLSSNAGIAFFPETIDDFKSLFFDHPEENYFIIGGGNNIILRSKKYSNKKFIIISDNFSSCELKENKIEALSGVSLRQLSELARANNLSGLEIYYDIPGTLGGAIWMNAGAYGESFMDLVEEVLILNKHTRELETLYADSIDSAYRYSQFQDDGSIILSATLKLRQGNKKDIIQKMDEIKNLRDKKLPSPKCLPNAGSVFRRPSGGRPVGAMVEELGLKGYALGGAMVSDLHAGFIVNHNNADADDILKLVNLITSRIYDNYGIRLRLEQVVVPD